MKKKLIVLLNFIILLFLNFNFVFAASKEEEAAKAKKAAELIYGDNGLSGGNTGGILKGGIEIAKYVNYFAIAIAVGTLMYLGIKFIVSAPEGKADVKKHLIMVAIGLLILFAISAVFAVAANLGQTINSSL